MTHESLTYFFSLSLIESSFQFSGIQREEEKIKRSLKEAAKKGDKDVCVILAKEILKARKAINKIHTTKAHLNSVQLQMKNQLGELFELMLINH